MAASSSDDVRKELTCAICLDFFKDPVILKCGHNFCRVCISMHWDQNGFDYSYQCPQCRTVFTKRTFTKNYLVQNLVAKMDSLDCLGSNPSQSPAKVKDECELHGEELRLFCHEDNKRICMACCESRAHRYHKICPVSEVVDNLKGELRKRLRDLNIYKADCVKVMTTDERTKNDIRMKKQRLKEKVEADVGALVQFLLDERDTLLDNLDAEEAAAVASVDDNLESIGAQAADATKHIADINQLLNGDGGFQSLVDTFNKALHQTYDEAKPADSPAEFPDFPGPFQLIMWKKMMHVLHTMPQNLTLDPDTAHPNLLISDFDTKVEELRNRGQEPDLPVRFTRFCGVLATAQYSGGQHYWEVDVRDKGVWYLGVTTEGSNRKGFVSLTPSAGYWSLCLQDRLYANGEDGRVPVADYWNSPRVGVYLDYDRGRLSFYDAVTMKRLYMFDTCFVEPVYPFFSPGKNDPGSRLCICHYY
ncbi:E3 ubiquitin-protein ligase TRIM47 [Syngnathus acus]|uniref:E3 ubiquitin-protein ligase TRIM47 n=1 Tax=Syngnathus acus TaxID=161584 RepID=UPI0018864ABB|nr:E3 ubiquitin-protein ligase TRIM47 [Syngnathus acus]